MVMERQNKYLVVKFDDAIKCLDVNQMERLAALAQKVDSWRISAGKHPMECVVVEVDWPEYEKVWEMISNRVDGGNKSGPSPEAQMEWLRPVIEEVGKALRKFPTWPTDPLHALAVLGEEYGELCKEMVQMTYEPHKTDQSKIRMEAIQTAAMALRLFVSLDFYEYKKQPQHEQGIQ